MRRPVLPAAAPALAVLALATLVSAGCAPAPPHAAVAPAPRIDAPPATPPDAVATPAAAQRRATPLARFFGALQRLETGRLERVRILQIGDSHTAGDVLSARLRARFQARFGDAGRGLLPPGIPYEGVRHAEVAVAASGRWAYDNSLRQPDAGPYGLAGFVARSRAPGSRFALNAQGSGFDSVAIDYLRMPGGGRFQLRADGRALREVATAADGFGLGTLALALPPGTRSVELAARERRSVALLGWAVERRGRGIVYDSLGVSGATVGIVGRWDPAIVKRQLEARRPALIVLAFGTNEGFQAEPDAERYAQQFGAAALLLQSAAPEAAILIVGPPEAQRAEAGCNRRDGAGAGCRWATPAALAQVRALQRAFAARGGFAFWDWSALMAPGGMDAWARAEPPLARPDRVHMTRLGYEASADALFESLMHDYAAAGARVEAGDAAVAGLPPAAAGTAPP